MSEKFAAFRATNSEGSKVVNMYADGFGIGVDLENSPNGEFRNLILKAPGAGQLDPEIARAFVEAMRNGSQMDREAVENAASKSGLLEWAADHGVDVGDLIAKLTERANEIDWKSIF